jgi:hypothetical protein
MKNLEWYFLNIINELQNSNCRANKIDKYNGREDVIFYQKRVKAISKIGNILHN